MPDGWGECGARGRGLISRAPGRLGHQPAGTRPACEVLAGLGQVWAGNARSDRVPGSLARVEPGVTKVPLARAVVERRQASAPDSGRRGASRSFRGAPRTPLRAGRTTRVCRRSASLLSLPGGEPQTSCIRNSSERFALDWMRSARSGLQGRCKQNRCLTSLAGGVRRENGMALIILPQTTGRPRCRLFRAVRSGLRFANKRKRQGPSNAPLCRQSRPSVHRTPADRALRRRRGRGLSAPSSCNFPMTSRRPR